MPFGQMGKQMFRAVLLPAAALSLTGLLGRTLPIMAHVCGYFHVKYACIFTLLNSPLLVDFVPPNAELSRFIFNLF